MAKVGWNAFPIIIYITMAKAKGSTEAKKIVFGRRRKGKHQKSFGPKSAPSKKKYVGQGR